MGKLTKEDEDLLVKLFAGEKVDLKLCEGLLKQISDSDENEARETREMLANAVALRKESEGFEAEAGMTMHEAILDLIERGEHEDVVHRVIGIIEAQLSQLPPQTRTAEFLRNQLQGYADALAARKLR